MVPLKVTALVACAVAMSAIATDAGAVARTPASSAYQPSGHFGSFSGSDGAPGGATAASSKRGRTYAGSNGNLDPVVVDLSKNGKRVSRIVETDRGSCQSGTGWPVISQARANLKVAKHGKFSGVRRGTFDLGNATAEATETFDGKVSGRKISASQRLAVSITDKASNQVTDTCEYKASSKLQSSRGRVYGGATSQNGAVVISRKRKNVKRLFIGWTAPCSPDGSLTIGDAFADFGIRGGRFGDTFGRSIARPDGGTNTFAYTVSGKVGAKSASGDFGVKVDLKDASGAPEASCDAGAVSWHANSG